MSLPHEVVAYTPLRSENVDWVSRKQALFYICILVAALDVIVWSTCEGIGPVRRLIFCLGLLCPLGVCLYLGHLALSNLDRAVREIDRLESGAAGQILVLAPFNLTRKQRKY